MTEKEDVLDGAGALEAYAQRLAATLVPGDVVALDGPLGAGKTTLVRALVRSLHGSDEAVSSPTFIVRQTYPGSPVLEHLDLYRIDDPAAELPELGLEDAYGDDRITLVEWPQRAAGLLPRPTITVRIDGAGAGPRTVRLRRA